MGSLGSFNVFEVSSSFLPKKNDILQGLSPQCRATAVAVAKSARQQQWPLKPGRARSALPHFEQDLNN
jgi:hypothetical protein